LLPGLVDPHPAGADYRAIPAQEVGGRLEENAPVVGQPREAQVITESDGPATIEDPYSQRDGSMSALGC
jgi:hypothetical protein